MNVTDDVLNDLLTLYLAGEASADTRALIEERARREPAFAATLAAARAVDVAGALPDASPAPNAELEALKRTRQAILLRTVFWSGGLLFTLLPLVFSFGDGRVEFLILGKYPGLMWSFWSVAAAAWVACYVMHREIRSRGL